MTGFLSDFRKVHSQSLAFAAALPLVAAIPLIGELVQHVVEMNIGMYSGIEGAQAAETNAQRMNFGFAKVLTLSLPAYFLIRWLHSGGDRAFATRAERPAVTLFILVMALNALFTFLGLFVFASGPVAIGFFVFGLVFMPLIVRFLVAAPLGTFVSPLQSIRTMLPHAVYAILFPICAMLPLMVVHYALGMGAVFVPGELAKWGILVVDGFVTAWLALVMICAQYVIAARPAPIMATQATPAP